MTTDTWVDRSAYPFRSHFYETADGRMHYVDEGRGPVLLLVHGTPTWSFLFREQIRHLSAHFRCIAADHLGFGLSEKPPQAGYRPQDHARRLRGLIDYLELREINLLVHDLGGPIGLSYALAEPHNIARLIISHTFLWPLQDDPAIARPVNVLHNRFGRWLYLQMNYSPRLMIPLAWGDRRTLTSQLHKQYLQVHSRPEQRLGLWAFFESVLGEQAWYDQLWSQRERILDLPTLLIWGMKDPAFGPKYLARWQQILHNSRSVTFEGAGHFVYEEQPAAISRALEEFLLGTPAATAGTPVSTASKEN